MDIRWKFVFIESIFKPEVPKVIIEGIIDFI